MFAAASSAMASALRQRAEFVSAAGKAPWRTNENCARLLHHAAPVGRIAARCSAVHDDVRNGELALEGFAARFEIDRSGETVRLLVERAFVANLLTSA